MMLPDYERAAIKATETLIKFKIGTAPVDPLPLLKKTENVLVTTFEEASQRLNVKREKVIETFGCENQDAASTLYINSDKKCYVVTYNKLLPYQIVDRALARELGHILLGHDGTRPEEVRNEEAKCFAHHLLCPRPLIHSLQAAAIRLTTDVIGNITGLSDYCLSCIRKQPSVHVPAELNRVVRDQFIPYILNFFDFHRHAMHTDGTALADLGNYMEGYEE